MTKVLFSGIARFAISLPYRGCVRTSMRYGLPSLTAAMPRRKAADNIAGSAIGAAATDELVVLRHVPEFQRPVLQEDRVIHQRPVLVPQLVPKLHGKPSGADRARVPAERRRGFQAREGGFPGRGMSRTALIDSMP